MISSDETFKEFEYSGWQNVAGDYHDYFAPLTAQTIEALLEAVGQRPAVRLLDVACGPGYVAAAARERGCQVSGVDFSPVMIEKARRAYPGIEFQVGDAECLPYPDGSFEAVVMNFGLLHLSSPESAVGEAFRVLAAGGRFAFTVWSAPEQSPGFAAVYQAIEKCGDKSVKLPEGPPFFRFSHEAEARRVMEEAGFNVVSSRTLPMTWDLPSADDFFQAFFRGTPRTGGLLRAQSERSLQAIRDEVRRAAAAFASGGRLKVPMSSILYVAARP